MSGSTAQPDQFRQTLQNPGLQLAIYNATGRLMAHRRAAITEEILPEYQDLRTHANAVKRHTIDHLDHYLEQFEAKVRSNGGQVIWCENSQQVADFILGLAKQHRAKLIVKSKSMTSEEVHLNERMEHHGLEAVETDLGEYIIQLAGEKPYHIVAPALHMTRYQVADLFTGKLGLPKEEVPERQTMIAREVLREKFLTADIGISGANFLIADTGSVVLVENEGNARLTTSAPKVHIAVAGIEKIIPRAQDLGVFLKLLGRSATGQPLTSYTSVLSGPKRMGEIDGPEEFYVVLVDNGRTKLLQNPERRQSLYCIRCGACLNHCPVYRKIGGHNYPWVYSGPIGAIITPQFHGTGQHPWLPYASSLCGACGEVCPVKIDIPKLLLDLRADVASSRISIEKLAYRTYSFVMRRPKLFEFLGKAGALLAPRSGGWMRKLPWFLNAGPLRSWVSQRDLPEPARASFREQWRQRQGRA